MNKLFQDCMEVARQKVECYKNFWWGCPDAQCKGTPPPAPTPAAQAAAGRDLQISDIESLPARKIIEAAAKAGTKGETSVGDRVIPYDFTNVGDLQQMDTDIEGMIKGADALAAMNLDIQERYGTQMNIQHMQRIMESDPVGWEVRQQLAQRTLEELSAGRELGAAGQQVEQSVRGAQTARGNVYGAANIGQEALAKFDMGQRLLTQRMANAQAYALGTPITAQYGNIAGAQQGAANFSPMQMQQGLGMDPTASARGQQGLMQGYGTYVQGLQNQTNPWMEGLGMVAGVAAQAAGGFAGGYGMMAGRAAANPGGGNPLFQGGGNPLFPS